MLAFLRSALGLAGLCVLASPLPAQEWSSWRVLGPFDHPLGSGNIDEAQAVERELRHMAVDGEGPDLEQVYRGKGGARLQWSALRGGAAEKVTLDVGKIDFLQAIEPPKGIADWNQNAVAYLYRSVTVDEPRDVDVNLGSDDGVRVWLDGELIIDRNIGRGLNLKDHSLVLHLEPGVNHLLVKVSQGGGGWGFQIAPWSKIPQSAINEAIDRGVAWLINKQLIDGSWGWREEYGSGHTAFVVYTLLKCGVREQHPAIRRALAYMEANPAGYTYTLGCEVLALAGLQSGDRRELLADRLDELIDVQGSSGLYAYPVHPGGSTLPEDLSNTLYAALACRAAADKGLDVSSRVWMRFAKGALRCLNRPRKTKSATTNGEVSTAGFGYRPNGGATMSMTTAGIGILAIVEQAMGEDLSPSMESDIEEAQEHALAWIDANMTWAKNAPNAGHHYFAVYGIERVGSLLGLERLGGTNWYWDGAEYLVQQQKKDGRWAPEHEYVDTLLALLFLKRATAPSSGKEPEPDDSYAAEAPEDAVHLRATGDTPLTIWVSGWSAEARDRLAWPGESGRGPHVARVEFLARRLPLEPVAEVPAGEKAAADGAPETVDPIVIATVEGDPAVASGTTRFATRQELPERGRWGIRARVHALEPPPGPGLEPTPIVLESADLAVRVDEILRPGQLEYPGDRDRNLLQGRRVKGVDSSHLDGNQTAAKTVDGRHITRWLCAKSDANPWMRLELGRPVVASRILLSHALPRLGDTDGPRATRIEILLNGKEAHMLDVNPDPLAKTTLTFEKPTRMRSIEIRILESSNRKVGADSVGFAEVELL